jgi:hypothetical protein
MTSVLRLDHVVLGVSELPTAIRQFNQMGFTVTPGGMHSGGFTHNAIVSFFDGTYLELLTTTRRANQSLLVLLRRTGLFPMYTARENSISRRLKSDIATGLGINDFCLLSPNLDLELPTIHSRGLNLDGPLFGGRLRPDGQQVTWRTVVPTMIDLPFLIDDITSRELRVPTPPLDGHSNQVIGIAGITLGVRNLEETTEHFRLLTGADPEPTNSFVIPGIQNIEFALQSAQISLVQPGQALPSMRKVLGRRVTRPLIVWLRTNSTELTGFLGLAYLPGKGITLSKGNPFG